MKLNQPLYALVDSKDKENVLGDGECPCLYSSREVAADDANGDFEQFIKDLNGVESFDVVEVKLVQTIAPDKNIPRRWRLKIPEGRRHPNGSDSEYIYGCYFPLTDLNISDMARPQTGEPKNVEWLD